MPEHPSSPGRPWIWVVDDSKLEADVARRALAAIYDVEMLADGSIALERLTESSRQPDLLVLDWQMPGVSGIDVCKHLRERSSTEALPVLMLTVQQDTRDLVQALAAGADDYVTKPFKPAELAARVAALLRTKQIRDRGERAERTMRELLEHHPDPLITVDGGWRIVFVNAEARRILADASLERDLLGRDVREVVPGLGLQDVQTSDPREHRLSDVQLGDRVFSPMIRPFGMEHDAHVTISLRDVTEQRLVEERRLDFYSIIAHDLRSPLAAITLKADLILRGTRGAITPEVRTDLLAMKARVGGLVEMVEDFLDLARMKATRLELQRADVDLCHLAKASIDEFREVAEARSVHLELEAPDCPATVTGDSRRLAQVFNNLLSNAVKFSRDGGTVRMHVDAQPSSVVVAVHDAGRGIAPDVLPRLFERYARSLDPQHKVAGTGLGLMITREIVEAHGGEVWARSAEKGSVFTFRVPRSTPAREATTP